MVLVRILDILEPGINLLAGNVSALTITSNNYYPKVP